MVYVTAGVKSFADESSDCRCPITGAVIEVTKDVSMAMETDDYASWVTSRPSLDTHTSLLNITEEEDEDDDESIDYHPTVLEDLEIRVSSVINDGGLEVPATPPRACCNAAVVHPNSDISLQNAFLDAVNGSFQSLCFSESPVFTPSRPKESMFNRQTVLEYDIAQILGCIFPPDDVEIERLWSYQDCLLSPTAEAITPPRPKRATRKERAKRIHKLAMERKIPTRSTTVISPNSVLLPITRTRSLGKGSVPLAEAPSLPMADEIGYDSDPEIQRTPLTPARPRQRIPFKSSITQGSIVEVVQESFNMTWTLMCHSDDGRVQQMTVWMERGSMVNNPSMLLEPSLCWRPVDAPLTTQPTCVRLLQVCRLLTIDEPIKEHPLARPMCTLLLKTSDKEEMYFEARNEAERDDTVRRWKATVARFASLAVLEDLDSIVNEFVHSQTNQMLVPKSYEKCH